VPRGARRPSRSTASSRTSMHTYHSSGPHCSTMVPGSHGHRSRYPAPLAASAGNGPRPGSRQGTCRRCSCPALRGSTSGAEWTTCVVIACTTGPACAASSRLVWPGLSFSVHASNAVPLSIAKATVTIARNQVAMAAMELSELSASCDQRLRAHNVAPDPRRRCQGLPVRQSRTRRAALRDRAQRQLRDKIPQTTRGQTIKRPDRCPGDQTPDLHFLVGRVHEPATSGL
jgi:hypothetical protein